MGELGINIDRNLTEDTWGLYLSGAKVIRFPFTPGIDPRPFIQELHSNNMSAQMVIENDSLGGFDWVNSDYEDADAYGVDFFTRLRDEYGLNDHVDSWQIGNEPDIESPSSWSMPQHRFVHLLKVAHYVLGRDKLVGGGLASGDPNWIADWGIERYVRKGGFHPYGQGTPDFPSPYGFGNVVDLHQGYVDATGLEFEATEFGANLNELGIDYGTDYAVNVLTWLKQLGNVNQFALRNNVEGFGMFDSDGNARPLFWEFQRLANEQSTWEFIQSNWLTEPMAAASMGIQRAASRVGFMQSRSRTRAPINCRPTSPNRYGIVTTP